jgi:hypothetical protein
MDLITTSIHLPIIDGYVIVPDGEFLPKLTVAEVQSTFPTTTVVTLYKTEKFPRQFLSFPAVITGSSLPVDYYAVLRTQAAAKGSAL